MHDGQVIQTPHLDALLNLNRITDLEMLQELTDDCLTIASCEEANGLINPSFFKNMRWIVTYLRDLKQVPINQFKAERTIAQIEAELEQLKRKEEGNG